MLAILIAAAIGYAIREVQQVVQEARQAEQEEYSREYVAARERARMRIIALRRLREMSARDN